ncbi:unnamed protein product [Periconia digitata]|uniref:Sphingolipid long chain base-responsive protein LSP1 n=1 Tax=Periconia digitata TaxID=1303443 RepID=A0A9W4UHA1_9PLEO|nr:unnamed protein product [Periconia digitata]
MTSLPVVHALHQYSNASTVVSKQTTGKAATNRTASPPVRCLQLAQSSSTMNRSLSVRSKKDGSSGDKSVPKHRFTMASLRGMQQPDLSKKLYKLIKSENRAIGAYETAGRERVAIAQQLSEWGEATDDDAVSEISDKLGVLLAEIAEQEEAYAQSLEGYRGLLKQIRNTESSVQPSRDHKAKVSDEIAKLKYKEPQSTKLVQLEQELVRSEAQNLVAEAQLSNVTRQKFKEAYDVHFAATIERAEKQIILARHARRMLNLLDDAPIVPGDSHPVFDGTESARQLLTDAENDLRSWQPDLEPIHSYAGNLGRGAMPESRIVGNATSSDSNEASLEAEAAQEDSISAGTTTRSRSGSDGGLLGTTSKKVDGSGEVQPQYPGEVQQAV